MKNIKDYIIETTSNYNELITYIQNILDTNKHLKDDESSEVMNNVRQTMKNYNDYDFSKIEKHFKIKGNYPNKKTNIEQWILANISK